MKLREASFTVFDVETTGLYPYSGDRICEIGAIKFSPARKVKKFHTLIDPRRPISAAAFKVNGITEDMLRGKPCIEDVLPSFMKFIEGSILVAYNAGFDVGFLEAALGPNKATLEGYYIIDALKLARTLFPDIGRYDLANVVRSLGIHPRREHRALSDAFMTLEVFKKELAILKSLGISTVESIENVSSKKISPLRLVSDWRLRQIEEAIREQKKLNITYKSSWNNTLTQRIITPKKIRSGYDRSYIVAHCHLRNQERVFRLDCIVDMDAEK
ncbi:MAG: exonuclease domain-containing protein [Candidatus Omnitrophica bacterium]|nr:exonuclease domain-containing protein [Candidatus Omnitrophota bacterium]MCM8790334.1 exonuclease domain-containing protein [Candidatus Omnitrophota bacterium]